VCKNPAGGENLGGLTTIFGGLDWTILLSVVSILICLTIHELAHGAAAYALGVDTAKEMGRLTLNPIRHIDPIGFVMLLLVGFGWARPVPVNMWKFQNPKFGMAITAMAGPLSNFILATVIFLLRVPLERLLLSGEVGFYAARAIWATGGLSVFLGVFNLFPIPPLDGSKMLFALLPQAAYYRLMRYERYGMFLLFALIFFGFRTGFLLDIMSAVTTWMQGWTLPVSLWLFS